MRGDIINLNHTEDERRTGTRGKTAELSLRRQWGRAETTEFREQSFRTKSHVLIHSED